MHPSLLAVTFVWLATSSVLFCLWGFDLVLVSQLDLAPAGLATSRSLVPEEVNADARRRQRNRMSS